MPGYALEVVSIPGRSSPLLHMVSSVPTTTHPKRHLDRFIRFRTTHIRDQQTRHTHKVCARLLGQLSLASLRGRLIEYQLRLG